MGGLGENSSGDIFLAFSTANRNLNQLGKEPIGVKMLPQNAVTPLFEAVSESTEEAINELMEQPMLASVLESGLAAFDLSCDGIGDLS